MALFLPVWELQTQKVSTFSPLVSLVVHVSSAKNPEFFFQQNQMEICCCSSDVYDLDLAVLFSRCTQKQFDDDGDYGNVLHVST